MPTERDFLIGALMGEAANQTDQGMAGVADVLINRRDAANPQVYGTTRIGAPNTIAGQLFANSTGVQFSSADKEATRREGKGDIGAYVRLVNSIFNPDRLSED